MRNKFVLFFVASFAALAQTTINGSRTILGTWDASGAARTAPVKAGTSLPGTCTVGDVYFKTDATAGQNLYYCTATNTWTQQLNSGGGTPSLLDTYTNITGASNSNGQLGFPTSGTIQGLFRNNGSVWQAIFPSDGRVMPSWDDTAFSWVNQGSATLTLDQSNSNPPKGAVLTTDTTASQMRARLKTSPGAGSDWSIAARISGNWVNTGQAGLALRVSGADDWWVYHLFTDSGVDNIRLRVVTYTDSGQAGGTARSSLTGQFLGNFVDVCVYNNSGSGNLEFKYATGGEGGYQTLATVAANTMGTVNQYGYYATTAGTAANQLKIYSMKEVAGNCVAF